MEGLSQGVYSRVGPSRGGDAQLLAQDGFKGLLHTILGALPIQLALPTTKVVAVITAGEEESGHVCINKKRGELLAHHACIIKILFWEA